MARRWQRSVTSQTTPTSGVAKTLWRHTAPANFGVAVAPPSVAFDGTSTTAAKAIIDVIIGATGGTAGATVTSTRVKGVSGSPQSTVQENFTAEPTGGATVHSEKWHTQGNWRYPGSEIQLDPGQTCCIRVTIPAAVPVNVNTEYEE